MSERWGDESRAAEPDNVSGGVTAGAMLRQAREAAGLHVAALAVALKVPVKKLEALEEDRWDLLPDLVFVRGLASSVCRTLKIDPQPILERLPQMATPRLARSTDGINTPFRAPSDGAPPTWFDQLTKPVYLAVFALLLGALVLILLPRTQQERQGGAQVAGNVETAGAPQPFLIPSEPPASSPVSTTSDAASVAPAAPAPVARVASAAALPAASSAAARASSPGAAMPQTTPPVAAVAPAPAASGLVVFRARGPSWVEVTDAKGVVAVRKELQSGEAAGASGVLPLQVTIGRVDNTDVQVRGKPFDLRPVSKDNVARFTVK